MIRRCCVEDALPDDRIGDAGFVLQRQEGDVALARPLADQDDAGDGDPVAVLAPGEPAGGKQAPAIELRPEEGERMTAQRKLHRAIILDHLAPLGQRSQRHFGLDPARLGGGEERQRLAAEARALARAPAAGRGRGTGRRRHRRASPAPTPAPPSAPSLPRSIERRLHRGGGDPRRRDRWKVPSPCAGRDGAGGGSLRALPLDGGGLGGGERQCRPERFRETPPHPNPSPSRGGASWSVQSQRLALTQTGRTSTPCSRASRTSWAGA